MKRCVECAFPVKSLYTQYGQGNIVLDLCGNCKQFVDPYIEHSGLLLLIDLFLLKPSVYRHVLFNKEITLSHGLRLAILLLSLESSFLTADELRDWKTAPVGALTETFIGAMSKVCIFFACIAVVSSIFLIVRERCLHLSSMIKGVRLVLNATLLSLVPSLVLLAFTLVFRDSYGALSPRHTSSLSHLPSSIISAYPWLSGSLTHNLEEALRNGVGIDMDQLGSAELKQTLIRGVVGNLSTCMGISTALGTSWWIGCLLLTLSYITHHLFILPMFYAVARSASYRLNSW